MPAAPAESGAQDLFAVGILLAIVGCFLLANSILFRHPRTLVAEFFGREERRLTSIRAYIFHRVQIHLGFVFLLLGFGLQLLGHYRPVPVGPEGPAFPTPLVGLVLLAVVVLELLGWWLSHGLFRRYVREYFLAHPPNLEADVSLSRELGDLFGIPSQGDDSVQSYLMRIRQRIGITGAPPRRPDGAPTDSAKRDAVGALLEDADGDEEFGLT